MEPAPAISMPSVERNARAERIGQHAGGTCISA